MCSEPANMAKHKTNFIRSRPARSTYRQSLSIDYLNEFIDLRTPYCEARGILVLAAACGAYASKVTRLVARLSTAASDKLIE